MQFCPAFNAVFPCVGNAVRSAVCIDSDYLLDWRFTQGIPADFAALHSRDSGALEVLSDGFWGYGRNVLNPYSNDCSQVSTGNYVSGQVAGGSNEMAWEALLGAGPNGEDVVEVQTGIKHIDGTALSPTYAQFYHLGPSGPHVGKTFRFRVVAKGNDGETVNINLDQNGSPEDSGVQFTFDGTWQTFEIEHTYVNSSAAELTGRIGLRGVSAAGGGSTGWATTTDFQIAEYNVAQVMPGQSMDPVTSDATAPLYLPRLTHNPVTLELRGYLHEQQSTNLSVDFSDLITNWTLQGVTGIQGNASPIKGDAATKYTEDTSTGVHRTFKNVITYVSGTEYTHSCFVKRDGARHLRIELRATTVVTNTDFDLENGLVEFEGVPGSADIEDAGNGWWRISVTITSDVSSTALLLFRITDDAFNTSYTGDGVSGIIVDGLQVEEGSTMSSPIPTDGGAAVIRQADTVETALPEFATATNFSMFTSYTPLDTDDRQDAIRIEDDSTASNAVSYDLQRNSSLHYFTNRGDVITSPNDGSWPRTGETLPYNIAFTYDADRRFVVHGAQSFDQTNPSEDVGTRGLDKLKLGDTANGIYGRVIVDNKLWSDQKATALANP